MDLECLKEKRRLGWPVDAVHPLHSLMSRSGSFPVGMANAVISNFSKAGEIVFDPFCGKGTTLLEAARLGRIPIGSDVAPEAIIVSRAKLLDVRSDEVIDYIDCLPNKRGGAQEVPDLLSVYFHPETFRQLLQVRKRLFCDLESGSSKLRKLALFTLGIMLGILHGKASYSLSIRSSHAFAMAPNYVRTYAQLHKLKAPRRDVKQCLVLRAGDLLSEGAVGNGKSRVYLSVAEKYTQSLKKMLAKKKPRLIFTSPPYMNAQTYTKDNWLRLWYLGYDFREIRKVSTETGSESLYMEYVRRWLNQLSLIIDKKSYVLIVIGDCYRETKEGKKIISLAKLFMSEARNLPYHRRLTLLGVLKDKVRAYRNTYASIHKDGKVETNGNLDSNERKEHILLFRGC